MGCSIIIKYNYQNKLKVLKMQIQQIFWQKKLSPKQLIIDWDQFISLFQQFILETISIKINKIQKQYIKSLIDPQNRNLVYKNSYLIFVNEFWDLPSNRTRLLKGQINLSKVPKLKFISDINNQESLLLKIIYIPNQDQQQQILQKNIKNNKPAQSKQKLNYSQKIYQWRNNKIYILDKRLESISQIGVKNQGFLGIGNDSGKNDIAVQDCQFFNPFHLKLIKIISKKPVQKKPLYMLSDDKQQKNEQQINWYIRDISKSNRLQYSLRNQHTYIIMRPDLVIKIGMIDEYQIRIIQATPEDISQNHIKQLSTLLNSDRINYLGQIDPQVPQKHIINIPTNKVKVSDIQYWFNKGYKYEQPQTTQPKKRVDEFNNKDNDIPLKFQLINKITQQKKQYNFNSTLVNIGRNKKNNLQINKVTIRDVECQFVCITGIWLLKNLAQNCVAFKQSKNHKSKSKQIVNIQTKKSNTDEITKIKLQQLSVSLAVNDSVNNLQCSNRILLNKEAQHVIKGKNFYVKISFPKSKNQNY